jgi:uncharacterized protein (TIGR02246 family)
MKRRDIAGCLIGLSILLAACSDTPAPAPDTSAADSKAIKDGEAAWVADYGSKDLDRVASHYADDATLHMPGSPMMHGKDAIRSGLKEMLADKNLSLNFTPSTVEVSKSGDLGYSQGTYSMTMTDPRTKKPVAEKGKYVTIYKKQADGTWKAIQDINNPDAPATPVGGAPAKKAAARPAAKHRKK